VKHGSAVGAYRLPYKKSRRREKAARCQGKQSAGSVRVRVRFFGCRIYPPTARCAMVARQRVASGGRGQWRTDPAEPGGWRTCFTRSALPRFPLDVDAAPGWEGEEEENMGGGAGEVNGGQAR